MQTVPIANVQAAADYRSFTDRETFAVSLLTTLSDVLETSIGRTDAEGFVNMVAHRLARDLNEGLLAERGVPRLSLSDLAGALVELKRKIGGGFRVAEVTGDRLVLVNSRCPFAERVHGREALCQMTSGVFGRLAADNAGYARVAIPEAIARGDGRCRVIIDLAPPVDGTEAAPDDREYYGRQDD